MGAFFFGGLINALAFLTFMAFLMGSQRGGKRRE